MMDVRKKILCIEDDRETAKLIADELSRRGFHPLIAYDGQVGLAAIQKRIPDLVLCDVTLPDMSGFEILAKLNENRPSPQRIPFLFLTGATGRYSELQGRNLGADDYLSKPIDFDILETVVRMRLAGGIARHQIGKLPETPRAARPFAPGRAHLEHVVEVIDAPTVHLDLEKPSRDMVAAKEGAAGDDHRQRDRQGSRRYEPRMCGRLAQEYDCEAVLSLCQAISHQAGNRHAARRTISPTETIDTICVDRGVRILEPMRWGLIPNWWKLGIAPTNLATFNARADVVATAPLFQPAGIRRHCLIPASGFYAANPSREICYVSRRDGSIMMLAGLWDEWCNPDTRELIRSCTVVIAAAGKSAPEIGEPVPVILEPEQFDAWLSAKTRPDWFKAAGDDVIGRRLTWKVVEEN